MSMRDDLGNRMKEYEAVAKNTLTGRLPVICRIDGRAFHSFTRGFDKPYDNVMAKTMQETMQYLCANVQNCVMGYCQSDEISLLLIDYATLESMPWFGNQVEKMVSVSASLATLEFNRQFQVNYRRWWQDVIISSNGNVSDKQYKIFKHYTSSENSGATFDSRVFCLPKEEVTNYFLWRQLDAIRNSVNSFSQMYFSHNELQNKNCGEVKEMLARKGIIWDDLPVSVQRGTCCVKRIDKNGRNKWVIDNNIPVFTDSGREYIDSFVVE